MAWNKNPQVVEMLSWHGHDRGGVHVPFQGNNPLGPLPLETNLIAKLRNTAQSIANGVSVPRWLFLVGGPGNGKSEAIQDFLTQLDQQLGMNGSLVGVLKQKFSPAPLVPRRVELTRSDIASSEFANRVGRLVVLQDATATEDPYGNAARQLANDIADLLTTPESPIPVYVVCANRGLLARALKEAYRIWRTNNDVTKLLAEMIKASGLGVEALVPEPERPSCWPLSSNPQVACWPLDLESLLLPSDAGTSAVEQIITVAVSENEWEASGRCTDCDAASLCPFRQNAIWLREPLSRGKLLALLRHGELATGQRWNFRDTFSLAAEILVGQWDDFDGADHPCEWVHVHAKSMTGSTSYQQKLVSSYLMLQHLYPQALFHKVWLQEAAEGCIKDVVDWNGQNISRSVMDILYTSTPSSLKPIRERLLEDYTRLDPAGFTPTKADHPLRLIEDVYSQSIELGNDVGSNPRLAYVEEIFLGLLEDAEKEWDWELLSRSAHHAHRVIALLRRLASTLVKRSVGTRLGHHANEDYLKDFDAALYDQGRLSQVIDAIRPLLGGDRFKFDPLQSFGQPQSESEKLVTLSSYIPGIRAYPASLGTSQAPKHDIPFFRLSDTAYSIPITFDFYLALRLRKEGCAGSSLPASVRASIDRVRHRIAGQLLRSKKMFVERSASLTIGEKGVITLVDEQAEPAWTPA